MTLVFTFHIRLISISKSAYKTWIFCRGWQRQVCWLRFFCPWLLSGPTRRWYSRLYLPHFGLYVHIICWELHNQAHGILPNEHGWPPCYVGENIQLMPAPFNLPLCGMLRFLGPCHNCHRSASLRSYVDCIWYWVSGPELPWSSFQFFLWVLHFLTKHNLLLCQQKVFQGCKKIVQTFAFPEVLLFSPSLCCPSTSLSMVFELLTKAIFILYCLCFLHENILPSQPQFLQACKTCLCPAQYNHSNWPCYYYYYYKNIFKQF